MSTNAMTGEKRTVKPFIISRVFDAPRDFVFKTWTESEHMAWWGPKGVTISHAKMELRPAGIFHYSMTTPDGNVMWGRWVLREIARPERLVFVNSFSDESGGVTRHPMSPFWPEEILSTITFEDENGKTGVTIEWLPINASEAECRTFDAGRESMQNGWSGSLDRLTVYLAETVTR